MVTTNKDTDGHDRGTGKKETLAEIAGMQKVDDDPNNIANTSSTEGTQDADLGKNEEKNPLNDDEQMDVTPDNSQVFVHVLRPSILYNVHRTCALISAHVIVSASVLWAQPHISTSI